VKQAQNGPFKAGIYILLLLFFMSGCSLFGLGGKKREKSPEELMSQGMSEFGDGDYTKSIELFQTLKDRYPYSKLAVQAELKLADSLFKKKLFVESLDAYKEFERLHPRNEAIPYVIYQEGMCHFLMMNGTDLDQTSAKEALKEFERLRRDFPDDPFSFMAAKRIRRCLKNLAEYEFYVGHFYYKSGHYVAALKRFEYLISHYPDLGQYGKTLSYIAKCKEKLAQQKPEQ
jgi:outer membrane protein assembly factor BamD